MVRFLTVATVLTALAFCAVPAHAITAGDVLDRMTAKERQGYISGAAEMLAHTLSEAGQRKKSACVVKLYFEGKQGREHLIAVFANHRDLPAVGMIQTIANRHCWRRASNSTG